MATNYPTSVDTPTDPTGSNTMDGVTGGAAVIHATQHANANDAYVAIQNAVGFTGAFKFQGTLTPTALKTANYTAVPGDFVLCDTVVTGAFTVLLPNAPANGTMVGLKYINVGAGLLVTYQCQGTDRLNATGGATSGVLTIKSQSETMQYQSSTGLWILIAGDGPLGQLDLRYAPITGSATYAPLASPALTGTPTAPTATALTNTTQLATTAFDTAAVAVETSRATTAEGLLTAKTALAGQYAYVASGCVWTADAPASTLNGSMSAGTVVIGGVLVTVNAISAHAFTASQDTYIDVGASGTVAFTGVANNTTAPALASSGTLLNTVRLAIVVSTGSALTSTAASINQGNVRFASATTLLNTTVAAGSNGQTISALTSSLLDVASTSGASASGGFAQVAHASGQTYTIQYTGITANTSLNGVTVISGAGTVSTSDVVTGFLPMNACDGIGNLLYPTSPYPRVIGASYFNGTAYTTTVTTAVPIPFLVTPFVVPSGPSRSVKMTLQLATFKSSAAAGTVMTSAAYSDNASSAFATGTQTIPVASDNGGFNMTGIGSRLAPGLYYAQAFVTQSAAGTMTIGDFLVQNHLIVELA